MRKIFILSFSVISFISISFNLFPYLKINNINKEDYFEKVKNQSSSSVNIPEKKLLNCEKPIDITVSNLTRTSGVINLNSNVSSIGYHYEIIEEFTNKKIDEAFVNTMNKSFSFFFDETNKLKFNTSYKIRIRRECLENIYSDWSDFFNFIIPDLNCNTIGLNVSNTTHQGFTITNNIPKNGIKYEVEIRKIDIYGITSKEIIFNSIINSDYIIDVLNPDTKYLIKLRRICKNNSYSDWLEYIKITKTYYPCFVPENIIFSKITHNSVVVKISDHNTSLTYEFALYDKNTNKLIYNKRFYENEIFVNIPNEETLKYLKTYQIKFRIKCEFNTWSDFSELYEFTTTEFECLIPTDIEILQITPDSFWVSVNIEQGESFQYKLYKDNKEIDSVEVRNTFLGYFTVHESLEPNTVYKIKIRRLCQISEVPIYSDFTELFEVKTLERIFTIEK
ncbi:fibronectin type III domain-containing protein [Aureivirga sp. CE67]|uniref:fibronectin type III domain-containing protein n=1 Tax=Aureivirga sp. CE67 TaxID=1788983 RepID=UPI0018CA1E83|nr:fibronectin type III domain-containing protein [Aureivirga sp. CE67]